MIITRYMLFIVATVAVGILLSCDETKGPDLEKVAESLNFSFVPDSTLELGETGEFILSILTDDDWSCANYILSCETIINTSLVDIDIHGAYLDGGGCYTALGPASQQIPILRTSGDFDLYIRNDLGTDQYEVSISDTIIVTIISDEFTTYIDYGSR